MGTCFSCRLAFVTTITTAAAPPKTRFMRRIPTVIKACSTTTSSVDYRSSSNITCPTSASVTRLTNVCIYIGERQPRATGTSATAAGAATTASSL